MTKWHAEQGFAGIFSYAFSFRKMRNSQKQTNFFRLILTYNLQRKRKKFWMRVYKNT